MTETTPTDLIDPRADLVRPGELSVDGALRQPLTPDPSSLYSGERGGRTLALPFP